MNVQKGVRRFPNGQLNEDDFIRSNGRVSATDNSGLVGKPAQNLQGLLAKFVAGMRHKRGGRSDRFGFTLLHFFLPLVNDQCFFRNDLRLGTLRSRASVQISFVVLCRGRNLKRNPDRS